MVRFKLHLGLTGCLFVFLQQHQRGMTFLERTGSPDEFIVPGCRGLCSPTRPIASAKFSKMSEVWLQESRSANVFAFTPLEVTTATGMICSRTAEETPFTDKVPTKAGAATFNGRTGAVLLKGGVPMKTGAAPWMSGWWYLLQPCMSHRFLHVQSRDW